MRRHIFILVLLVSLFLLHACASTNNTGKEAPSIFTTGQQDSPAADVTAQAADSPEAESGEPASHADAEKTPVFEKEEAEEVSPQISAEATSIEQEGVSTDAVAEEPLSPPGGNTTPDMNAEQPTAEPPQNDTGGQPPLLTQSVQKAGLSFEDFDFSQLVLVAADGSQARLYCYNKSDTGLWQIDESIGYINGYIGRNGVSSEKREGDDATPAGLFSLGYAFGNRTKPSTGMEYRQITKESYWVDDPNSIYYNQWVEGTAHADWSSAEHLSENINTYAYAVVVEYNTAPNTVAGNGSAIFLHCKNEPTSGCIAVSEEAILKILKWLTSDKSPSMLIAAQ